MVREIQVKTILNKHKKRDSWFLDDYTVNPYSSCEFNCLYCYIRGSKYGENLEKSLSAKVNAPSILDRQLLLREKKGEFGFIVLSSATEPYPSIEEKYGLTRRILQIILKHRFPVHVITKSTGVIRDLDLLEQIDNVAILPEDLREKVGRGVIISFSFSTLDDDLAKILEPRAPKPSERLKTLKKVKEKGFLSGIINIPVLPFITDTDDKLEEMVVTAKKHNADYLMVGALTLFGNKPGHSKYTYYRFLENHYPGLIAEYKKLYRIFSFPPKKYQEEIYIKALELCNKHNVRPSITGDPLYPP